MDTLLSVYYLRTHLTKSDCPMQISLLKWKYDQILIQMLGLAYSPREPKQKFQYHQILAHITIWASGWHMLVYSYTAAYIGEYSQSVPWTYNPSLMWTEPYMHSYRIRFLEVAIHKWIQGHRAFANGFLYLWFIAHEEIYHRGKHLCMQDYMTPVRWFIWYYSMNDNILVFSETEKCP